MKYRVAKLPAYLGWIDFNLGCSIILPTCSATYANFPSAQAHEGGTLQIKVNYTKVH